MAGLVQPQTQGKSLGKAEQAIAPDRVLPQVLRPLAGVRGGDPGVEELFYNIGYFLHDKSPFKKYSYMCYVYSIAQSYLCVKEV